MEKENIQKWIEENQSRIGLGNLRLIGKKSGESNHNFVLESSDERYILRVSREVSREDRLENEAEKLGFLESQNIENVPQKLFFDKNTDIGSVLIETFAGEKDLDKDSLTDARLKSLARKMAEIHSIPVEKYNQYFNRNESLTANLKDIFRKDFENWSKRPYEEYLQEVDEPDPRIENYFKKQKQLLESVPDAEVRKSLVHGDLGFNIRASGSEIFIVDWEFSRIDHPDLEILYCFEHEKLDNRQRKVFLKEYTKHRELGEKFEQVRKIYPGFLAFNDAVWAAKRIEIEPEEKKKHSERLENKLAKLERFYSERERIK